MNQQPSKKNKSKRKEQIIIESMRGKKTPTKLQESAKVSQY
jgi:hypothetical protein